MAVTRTPPRKLTKDTDINQKEEKPVALEHDMGLEISITGPHITVSASYIKHFGAKMLEVAIVDSSIESLTIKNSIFEDTFDILSLIGVGLRNSKLLMEFDHSISPEQVRQEGFKASLIHLTEKMRDRILFDVATQNVLNITKLIDHVYDSPPKKLRDSSERLFARRPLEKSVFLPPIKDDREAAVYEPFIKASTAKRGRYDDRPILGAINAPAPTKKNR